MAKRRYEQRLRARTAEGTRRRVLDAVYARLREASSEPVSIDRVARMAGVARSTVYLLFGSRAGLFDALGDDLMRRDAYRRLLEAVAHPDARETLRRGIRAGAEMFAGQRDVIRALYSMAQLDEEAVGGSVQRFEAERTRGMARLARRLDEQGALRPGVTRREAADLLWVLTSFESFDLLHAGRGLSVDEAVGVLTATAERSLLR
jgi:AcrR family transcriptional regulator